MDTESAAEVIATRSAERTVLGPVASKIRELAVLVELTYCEPTSNSALRFDLDGPTAMGRLTWWSDGSSYLEVLRVSDGETLLSLHSAASTSAEASSALFSLAESVAGLPSNSSFKPNPLRGSA